MKIVSMTATFGGLDRATLTLSEGLNLLELPNESGKSTWCAFLRAMFYGLESRKGGPLSERNRYTPWSGAPMAGTVDLIWNGKAITLRRFGKGSNPFGGFQAVYTGTEEPVPGLTADNAGEVILGVTKEAFQRTCFIPQGGLWVDASGDLERRIAALASAGEEDVSYSDAEGRLRDWRNARQSNRATGTLPKLRARLAETQNQRQRLLDARERGARAQIDLERLEQEQKELEAELARHAQLAEATKLADVRRRYEDTARRLGDAEEALMEAKAAETEAKDNIPDQPRSERECRVPIFLGAISAVVLEITSCLAYVYDGIGSGLPLTIIALACMLAGIWRTQRLIQESREAQEVYTQKVANWELAKWAVQAAQEEHIAARSAWEAISAQGEPPAAPALSDRPRLDLARAQADLARVKRELVLRQDLRARAQGEETALGGPEPMDQELARLEGAIAKEEQELDALNLALEALAAANAQLQTRFSPALNAKAGELLDRLTGGRHKALTFTREFQALAQGADGPRAAQLLSQGTADQVYLALRLAICLLALPKDDPAPLILDDALVSFDDTRLKLALDVLGELAGERQVLLFTCQSRERLACNFPVEPL